MPEITLELLSYIIAGLSVLVVFLIIMILKTNSRISKLLRGKNAEDLEDSLSKALIDTERSLLQQEKINILIKEAREGLKKTVSGVGVVRFNPFEGSSGSNQSFSVALINKHGDGVVLSSLYSREKVSVFAKPIDKFSSTYKLTEEETRALGKARGV
jgi:hypothetical protein